MKVISNKMLFIFKNTKMCLLYFDIQKNKQDNKQNKQDNKQNKQDKSLRIHKT